MERRMSATAARARFSELMQWVEESQRPVIVERRGKPQMVVLSVVEYQRLVAGQRGKDDWRELVNQAREQIRTELGERELTPSEEVLRQVREERDKQFIERG